MAVERIENITTMDGRRFYVHLDFENSSGDVIQFIYANALSRPVRLAIYRRPQNTVLGTFDVAPGTPESTRPAPNTFNLVKDAEGYWSFDPRWGWSASMV
jgi:hypothetical protein